MELSKEQKHSKLPWHIAKPDPKGKYHGFGTENGKVFCIYSTNDDLEIIAKVLKDKILAHSVQNNEANAEFIVEACNSYYKLKDYANKVEELLNKSIKELTGEVDYLSKDQWDPQYVEFSGKLEFAKQLLTELKTLKP